MYDDSDFLSGYRAPIEMIVRDIQTQIEDNCVKAVQQYGFIVDKEELKKALEYDRGQYEEGYEDGYRQGVINGKPRAGEWIYHERENELLRFKCNQCGVYHSPTNFCPNCGADMRGEEE